MKEKEKNKPRVIFEDGDILVLDKPSDWIVNISETTGGRHTVQDWIAGNFDFPLSKDSSKRSGIVHRIDKETSGILLVAKTAQAFENMQNQFRQRTVTKNYTALVHGKLEPKEGDVNAPVGRLPWNRERFGVFAGGKDSESRYKVTVYYKKGQDYYSLVLVFPKTGRTHQIRVHLKYLNHPIVSDPFYAGRKTSQKDRRWCPRLFLHATEINFLHPTKSERVTFSSELPDDLNQALHTLEKAG